MQINPIGSQSTAVPPAQVAPKAAATSIQAQAAPRQDSTNLSQKAKDLAAQMSGKTMQEEAKESPVVEANEGQGK